MALITSDCPAGNVGLNLQKFSIMRERSKVAVGETAVLLHPRLHPY